LVQLKKIQNHIIQRSARYENDPIGSRHGGGGGGMIGNMLSTWDMDPDDMYGLDDLDSFTHW